MATLVIGGGDMRRLLYEAVAEASPELHGQWLMACERGIRFDRALRNKGALGKSARAALPIVQAFAAGKATRAQVEQAAAKNGFRPQTLVDAAACIKIRSDGSDPARAVCAVVDQIERAHAKKGAEVGWFGSKILRAAGNAAHNLTHKGPIHDLEMKAQNYVTKALPITKPFVNFHRKVSSILTEKMLKKAGIIGHGKRKHAGNGKATAPGVAPAKALALLGVVKQTVTAASGRRYDVTVRPAR